jgi:uncharacterized metal-binding protein YceD (DUF177 family)
MLGGVLKISKQRILRVSSNPLFCYPVFEMRAKMDLFKIYINRLNNGQTHKHEEDCPPDFLGVSENFLKFEENIHITGSTYLADDHLITQLNIHTAAVIPCSICNEPVRIPIAIKDLYLSTPIADIKGAIHDLSDEIRESILLQVPQFAECSQGRCPQRAHIEQFLGKKLKEEKKTDPDSTHFPFSGL